MTNITIPSGVTRLGNYCFAHSGLTSVVIPNAVTNIGDYAFSDCATLTSVTLPTGTVNIGTAVFENCYQLGSIIIPVGVNSIGANAFLNCYGLTHITIPVTVTNLGYGAFYECHALTNITIPASVTSLGDYLFYDCYNLAGVYFAGNAPSQGGSSEFFSDTNAIAYYLPGTTGWALFSGIPTMLWNPQGSGFGVRTNQFGFTLTGPGNVVIVVEACTNLLNPLWQPVQTNTLTGGAAYVGDPQWTNYPARFYRFRSP
jgi:hypothetical protein